MKQVSATALRRRLLGSTALWSAAAIGAAVVLGAGPALADCNVVGLGGDLTNESNVAVSCTATGSTETTQQGDGTNNTVDFTVGSGASIVPGAGRAIYLNDFNTLTINGSVLNVPGGSAVRLGTGNQITVNNGGLIDAAFGPALHLEPVAGDLTNSTVTVNSGGTIGGATSIYGVLFQNSGGAIIGNTVTVNSGATIQGLYNALVFNGVGVASNTVTINSGATVQARDYGLVFGPGGAAAGNIITVNGTLQQTGNVAGLPVALFFSGDANSNSITIGAGGLVKARYYGIAFADDSNNNVLTINGSLIQENGCGCSAALFFAFGTHSGNTITVGSGGVVSSANGYGINFIGLANSNTITVNAGGRIFGALYGVGFTGGGTGNQIINNGTLTGGQAAISIISTVGGESNVIVNNATGVITGTSGLAIDAASFGSAGAIFLTNLGAINGNVVLGSGADTVTLFTGQTLSGSIDGGAGADTLTLDGAGVATFANTITGNSIETLTKQGAGTWTLGASQTFTGGTSVIGGKLVLGTGTTLTSNVTVNGGTLGGNGTVAGGLTQNGGTIAPGSSIGTLVIAGNATLSNGSFELEVDRNSADRLIVGGSATLVNESLQVVFLEPLQSKTYEFVTATGGLTGQFAPVLVQPSLFVTANVTYSANSAFLNVTRTAYSTAALLENQQGPAGALDRGFANATGDALAVFSAFDTLTTAGQAGNAFQQLGGQIHTAFQTTGIQNVHAFAGAVRNHSGIGAVAGNGPASGNGLAQSTDGSRYTGNQLALAASGDSLEPMQVALGDIDPALGRARGTAWLRGFGLLGSADGKESRASLDIGYRIAGLAGGADYAVTREITIGGALGYSNTQVDQLGGNSDNGSVDTVSGALYASWTGGPWYADGMLGYAHNDYSTERQIIFGGLNRTATADYSGGEIFVDAQAGYRLRHGGFSIVPSAGLAFTHSRQDSFTEQGAGAASLAVDSNSVNSIRASLGARVSYAVKLDSDTVLTPELRARYQRELGDDQRTIDAQFAGIPGGGFTTRGAEPSRNAALLGAGLTATVDPGLALFVDYDADLRVNAQAHAVTGGLRFTW